VNKAFGHSHASQETATNCGYVGLQVQAHCVESRIGYYWELRSRNAQNSTNVSTTRVSLKPCHLKLVLSWLAASYKGCLRKRRIA